MKTIKYIFGLSLFLLAFLGCEEDDNFDYLNTVVAPTNVSALFQITQDNSGLVKIIPNSEGAVMYNINFGDSSEPAAVEQGEAVEHIYAEGNYVVSIEAIGLTGLKTVASQDMIVSFKAPENVKITIEKDASNPFIINVSAEADYANGFEVYFGDDPDAEPVLLMLGSSVSHTYELVGEYIVRVIALSGGAETTESTETVTISAPTNLPIDFEAFDKTVLSSFDGGDIQVIENPDANGNPSAYVAQLIKGAGQVWAGSKITLSSPIDFSVEKSIKMKVWSPRIGARLIFKVEDNLPWPDTNGFEPTEQTTTVANSWEELVFDFSDVPMDIDFNNLVLIFDNGTMGDGSADYTFYIDDIEQFSPEVIQLPITFETAGHTFNAFNGAGFAIAEDPEDANNKVGMITNAGGGWGWEGISLGLDVPVNFSEYQTVKLDFYTSDVSHTVLLKFEDSTSPRDGNGNPTIFEEGVLTVTETGWSELTFNFSSADPYDTVVLFVDGGQEGITGTYYVDNIEQVGANSQNSIPSSSILDMEAYDSLSSFDGGDISVIANPDKNGNSSDFVAQLIKNDGQPWAGSKITFADPLTFTSETTVTIKVWSPRVGLNLLAKFEDATPWPNTVASAEVPATTTVANQWEELTFDFAGISTSVDFLNLVLIMDNGTVGDGSANYTIYVDDIKQTSSASSSSILDMEAYDSLSSFDGGDISVIANPDKNGNSSDFVAQLIKNDGQPWAGSKITFADPLTFTSETTVTIKVWSPRVGLNLLAKFEDATPWPNTVASAEVPATTTVANQWEELTFDFAGISTSVDFLNLVLIMDNGTVGDGSANYTIYVDDIKQN